MNKIKKIKKIRIHREGTHILVLSGLLLVTLSALILLLLPHYIISYLIISALVVVYLVMLNFFRCPIRLFQGDTENIVVAPADGKIVVIEEVEENEYFKDRRLMISIFMSLFNVHANWFPVDGKVVKVEHDDGNFHKAYLPKASLENERSMVVIETPEHGEILVRQIAGAIARRIVTYAHEGEDCYIDEHLGFIKFGSRVDVYLPIGTEVKVELGQHTVGNNTIIAQLKK
ncbi:MAG: phosphatidylserine decarboxylase family protein [Prevotellaceae bacterium]|nr:phosphatidylserine decarboxylase family protein [Candidatus Faecinaster equi]